MIRAKNCEKLSKFVKVTARILPASFFPDIVYILAVSGHKLVETCFCQLQAGFRHEQPAECFIVAVI